VFARAILLSASLMWPTTLLAQTIGAPLVLEAKIPLGEVKGRIDHLGIDAKRQRLLVAELGNNSVGVVDLSAGKVLRRIVGIASRRALRMSRLPTASLWRMPVKARCACCGARI
jgi:hypothetical protein